ncbi:hypothetical protein GH714_039897 [Hevea brasiliensis]|uniref:Uncharacterized protein n=2 Tax=Hevea brasiliensis TaxID=3981 RepID=A0A6A6M7A6_HEVBR|nr:hypothetical protein GH714_039897 [Hevea brasiliensis]
MESTLDLGIRHPCGLHRLKQLKASSANGPVTEESVQLSGKFETRHVFDDLIEEKGEIQIAAKRRREERAEAVKDEEWLASEVESKRSERRRK